MRLGELEGRTDDDLELLDSNLVTRGKFLNTVDLQMVMEAWQARGCECDTFDFPPGFYAGPDIVFGMSVHTVLNGRLRMKAARNWFDVTPGDEVTTEGARIFGPVMNVQRGATRWVLGWKKTGT